MAGDEEEELEKIKQMKLKRMIEQSRTPTPPPKPKILQLSDATFDGTMTSERLLLVDFYADWCGPCKTMEPVLENLSARYVGRVTFARLNVDNNPLTAGRYGIEAIPTFILFSKSQPAKQIVGAVGERDLTQLIERSLTA